MTFCTNKDGSRRYGQYTPVYSILVNITHTHTHMHNYLHECKPIFNKCV